MRVPFLLIFAVPAASAFAPPQFNAAKCQSSSSSLFSASSAAESFMARVQASPPPSSVAASDKPPVLFDDTLLADMQTCLLTLERRVREGPGSLSHDDVDTFAMAAARVLDDMVVQSKQLEERMRPGQRQEIAEAAALMAAEQAEEEGKSEEEIEMIAKAAFENAQAKMIPPPTTEATTTISEGERGEGEGEQQKVVTDTSLDEGPEYQGKGGMGQPLGTVNTYVLEGMDEMTAEEYQKALEQEVIKRANERRKTGKHGNRGTWDYLQNLQGGTGVNILSRKDGFQHDGQE